MVTTVERVREALRSGDISKSGLARAAGLHANSLRAADSPDWNPTADTLSKLDALLNAAPTGKVISPPEAILDDARNGRMVILIDDDDRENEGDLVLPAQFATPDAINFMARHGRGLICLALTPARVAALGLPPMAQTNRTRHATAFTVSIEAREGVTTGISAADRARTIAVAIDSARAATDIVSPGHVFPLIARDGGVLVRAGHTEASVDVARLAGLNPSGVICEIMRDDGQMARLDDLIPFAATHGLKIGTIRDLIAYRLRHDRLVECVAETQLKAAHGGDWRARVYLNRADGGEHLALLKGEVRPGTPTLVRMHAVQPFEDLLGIGGPRAGLLARAMEAVGEAGAGIVVLIRDTSPGLLSRHILGAREDVRGTGDTGAAQLRDYGIGAQILADLAVHDMVLLTNRHRDIVGLDAYGLNVVEERAL